MRCRVRHITGIRTCKYWISQSAYNIEMDKEIQIQIQIGIQLWRDREIERSR
jgi:primosomal replication protein N